MATPPPAAGPACIVDKDAIAAHYNTNFAFQIIPMLGPVIGQVASTYGAKIPTDHQADLDKANGTLKADIDEWRKGLTNLTVENTQNLDALTNALPNYIQATATLADLPTKLFTYNLFIQIISLSIIMAIVIFLGL